MDFSDFKLDPQLSLGEKRRLVREIARWSEDAPMILSSLTRRQLLEIICAEMGKERKYSGYNKMQMIAHLLKLVSKNSKKTNTDKYHPTPTGNGLKRQRKHEQLCQTPIQPDHAAREIMKEEIKILLCENIACRASMGQDDAFCKRCSCCICHQYDDNKDPSLWLTCDSDASHEDESCGMTCHLKCAVLHEQAGILKNGCRAKLDGGFYCVYCGKVNGLMRIWRKQLLVAKEARRVDVLCLRVSLSHKILKETEEYKELLKIVESCVKTLENEVGPLELVAEKMDRLIVNRLSCGTEVQKLCTYAVEVFDSMSSFPWSSYMDQKKAPTCRIRFEESSPNSVIIVLEYEDHLFEKFLGCRLWHRKSTGKEYPEEASSIVLMPGKTFKLTDLDPSTEYFCKVSFFSNTKNLGPWEAKWVTPASSGSSVSMSNNKPGQRENVVTAAACSQYYSAKNGESKLDFADHLGKLQSLNSINKNKNYGFPALTTPVKDNFSASPTVNPPSTPFRFDKVPCSGWKKQMKEKDYEYSVRIVKRLEHEGHLNKDFRVKFLTWFSLKATVQERRVVSIFVDTLIDDPSSLAEQLIDSFMDKLCGEQKKLVSQHGFLCSKLWR